MVEEGVREAMRKFVSCMALKGSIALNIQEVRECLGDSADRIVAKLMDAGILAYLDDGKCDFDKCGFTALPKWGRRRDVIALLRQRDLKLLMERYGGDKAFGDAVAWWIARVVFDHDLYDAVDLSQYDLKNGAGTVHYHIYDNVWLVSYVEECGRRRCFRYEVVTK